MKKNNYSIEGNFLSFRTECGLFKFKIDGNTGLESARQIAEVMIGEMEKVEKRFKSSRDKSSPYAKLLMSHLNICEQYVQLEKKYTRLAREAELLKAVCRDTALPSEPVTNQIDPDAGVKEPLPERSQDTEPSTGGKAPREIEPPQDAELARATEPPQDADPSRDAEPATAPEVVGDAGDDETTAPETDLPETDLPESDLPESDLSEAAARPAEPARPDVPDLPGSEPARPENPAADIRAAHPAPLVRQVLDTLKSAKETGHAADEPATSEASAPQAGLTIHNRSETVCARAADVQSDNDFLLPSLDFLNRPEQDVAVDQEAIRRDAELLEQKLGYFGIKGEVMAVSPGPVITTFEYKPAPGIKISKIVNLADDLALALSALSIRLVAPIPGKDVIGIEIPNARMSIVPFVDIVGSQAFADIDSPTPICLGKDIIGNPVVVGLEKMPHLLIAGATGTGKSVALNAMISSILYKSGPDRVKFIMIDPKRIELSLFNDIPHLITPVITDMKKATIALQWVVREMERRYERLAKLQVRNIRQYNRKVKAGRASLPDDDGFEPFSYIVIIIDELADLMMTASKDIEFSLTRIAQMARAAGIHLILATQRPSVDVLTGIIKANFPTRISFQVSSKTDSRTIIDANGAETLLGRGDMLFVPPGTARLTRVHGTYLSERELLTITDFIKAQGRPEYLMDVITEQEESPAAVDLGEDEYDEKYQAALEFVVSTRQASISGVQRALRVGYNRAARIIDLMEKRGVVGPSDGVKPRQVLVDRVDQLL